jgi:hypothetical protein
MMPAGSETIATSRATRRSGVSGRISMRGFGVSVARASKNPHQDAGCACRNSQFILYSQPEVAVSTTKDFN